ncbi:MAG: D-aminoacyl-tRNA deacylase [Chitinophagales bacterium]
MRAVVQRVSQGKVLVEGQSVGEIGPGLVVLVGVGREDTSQDAEYMVDKISTLRVFDDEEGKMNLAVTDIAGSVLLVSQFTLYGDARKGRRPSYSQAAGADEGLELFNRVAEGVTAKGIKVATGQFGAHMEVEIFNDGPCTIMLDSHKQF